MKEDNAIIMTYMNRDRPYTEAELLVVHQAVKNLGVKMPREFDARIKYILSRENNPNPPTKQLV